MNTLQLLTALTAALPFASKDTTRPHLAHLAVSKSRVRATNGHVAIHVWDKEAGDKDDGDVVMVSRSDARLFMAIAKNTASARLPRRRAGRTRTVPLANFETDFTQDSFSISGRRFPIVPCGEVFPPSDKIMRTSPSKDAGVPPVMQPCYVAMAAAARDRVGAKELVVGSGLSLDVVSFYGESASLCVLVAVMPVRSEETFAKAMERRAAKLVPPAPPKTEIELLREENAALKAKVGA